MAYEATGELHKIYDTESKKNNFQVRQFVIKTKEQYPQYIKFQLTQDRCDLLNNYNEGQEMKVSFDIRGNEWNGNFITNLNAWRLEEVASEVPNQDFPPIENQAFPDAPPPETPEMDDLPF